MQAPNRPNVLLITSDQQHFTTLSYAAGNPHIQTPNPDRLTRQGTRFSRAYCNNPTCTPSRATIITGQYPSTHGGWAIGTKTPEDLTTLGDCFRNAGYDTALIGKAHFQPLGDDPDRPETASLERQPILRDLDFWRAFNDTHTPWYGFDHVELARNHTDEAHCGQHYAIWMEEKGLTNWRDYFDTPNEQGYGSGDSQKHRWTLPEQYHYSVWTAERTIARIEKNHAEGKPFFCWSSFHDPHPSYLVPEPWASMYDSADVPIGRLHVNDDGSTELDKMPPPLRMTQEPKPDFTQFRETPQGNHGYHGHLHSEEDLRKNVAIYYGMVSLMDREIGRILDSLDALQYDDGTTAADHTLVVFTTDHGHYIGQHGPIAKGAFHYEDGIKLPFVARWPGRIPADAQCDALTQLLDLAPTFLAAAGLEVPGTMQGSNQLPIWEGRASDVGTFRHGTKDDPWYPGRPRVNETVICEFRHQPSAVHLRTLITERHKLTLYRGRPWGELFDLHADPAEIDNKFDDPTYASVKAELMERFMQAEIEREPTRLPRIASA